MCQSCKVLGQLFLEIEAEVIINYELKNKSLKQRI